MLPGPHGSGNLHTYGAFRMTLIVPDDTGIEAERAAARRIKSNLKALLALMDEQLHQLATAVGYRAGVLIPYSYAGFPNGNYHRPGGCRRINRNSTIRTFHEVDAAKFVNPCPTCFSR